jgi:hypothetical protein
MPYFFNRIIAACGDRFYNHFFYYYLHLKKGVYPKFPSFKKPETFNEKIIFLKTKVKYPEAHKFADKILVRSYVENTVGKEYLIPLIGTYNSAGEIDYTSLPDRFVLKANHGSGMNILCNDKARLNIKKANEALEAWLQVNYFDVGREYQYQGIMPRLLCEELLLDENDKELKDYKLFCFRGEPKFIQVDIDRHSNHTRNFYDLEWNRLPFSILYPQFAGPVTKPDKLDEMVGVARALSQLFIFSRIDLYYVKNRIYFGEITLHHGGGFEPITPKLYDRILGGYIDLKLILRK